MALSSATPSFIGRWNALRPEIRPMPPARLLITAVLTASFRSLSPADAPPELMSRRAAHVAVGHLVARQVDRVVAGQLRVDRLVRLAEVERVVAAVVLGQLLLDDVGLDRHAEVVRLAGEVGGEMIVGVLRLERRVAQVAPEHREHAQLVRLLEHLGDFLNLPLRFLRAEVDRRADARRAHVERLLDAGEPDLVVACSDTRGTRCG